MRIAMIIRASPHPVGAVKTQVEHGNALARLGHEVHQHFWSPAGGDVAPDDIAWLPEQAEVVRHLEDAPGLHGARPDIVFGMNSHPSYALAVRFFQGEPLGPRARAKFHETTCPRICVSQSLVDWCLEQGVPAKRLVYVPNGVDHGQFYVRRAIEDRPPRVAMMYHPLGVKAPTVGLEALELVRRQRPDARFVVFSAHEPRHPIPDWVDFHLLPEPEVLADEIYNGSSVFVCSSNSEGFGRTSVEAMASGCALVTTDNGGSREFANHKDTALVSEVGDAEALGANIESLLADDGLRIAVARRGVDQVAEIDWDISAGKVDAFLEAYRADPEAYLSNP